MTLKKWKVISVIGIFLLSSLFHFIYTWFPTFFTTLFFPVNESIWEHNKIIVLSFLVWALFEKIYYKDSKNTIFAGAISAIICIILVLLIFTPIYLYILNTKDNIIVTFIIYFICIAISQIINYKLLIKPYNNIKEKIAIVIWIGLFIIGAIFTYYPFHEAIFYDYNKKIYGLK